MPDQSAFAELAILLALAAAIGFAGMLARQPLIVGFIALGLLAGPSALDLVHSHEQIELLAELGIAMLLFLVGIKLDLKLIRSLGAIAMTTGLAQVAITATSGFAISLLLGFPALGSLYIAIALSFSSTIIIVKLLSDKREIDALHGQVALGLLIVQDIVVVLAMIGLSAVGMGAAAETGPLDVAMVLVAGLALLALVLAFIRYVADPLTERMASSPELLICYAIALAICLAAIGDWIGLGKELGGLLAGIALASTRFREAISSRLVPLRDFLLLFFFVSLGSTLDLRQAGAGIAAALVLSVFVLVGKPLIVMAIMGVLGFRKRTGFLTGVTIAQISEFSLILVAMGASIGQLGSDVVGVVTMVGIVTIAFSTYMITFSHTLYEGCERWLGLFERRNPKREPDHLEPDGEAYDIVLFGLGRYGTAIGVRLIHAGKRVLGVDFNPAAVRRWREMGHDGEYGDASDPEFIATLPLERVDWFVSSIPPQVTGLTHEDARLAMIAALKAAAFGGKIALTSHGEQDSAELKAQGADLVLEPFQDAADQAVDLISGLPRKARIAIDTIAGEVAE